MDYDWAYIASGAAALAVIAAIVLILVFAVFGKRESMGNDPGFASMVGDHRGPSGTIGDHPRDSGGASPPPAPRHDPHVSEPSRKVPRSF